MAGTQQQDRPRLDAHYLLAQICLTLTMQHHKYLFCRTVLVWWGVAAHIENLQDLNEPGSLDQWIYQHDEFIGFASRDPKHWAVTGLKMSEARQRHESKSFDRAVNPKH